MRTCSQSGPGAARTPVLVHAGGLIHARDREEQVRAQAISSGIFSLLISSSHINKRITELAHNIICTERARRHEEICLLIVLKGAVFFGCRLAREISSAGSLPVAMHFISAASYGNQAHSSGRCRIAGNLNALHGKDVIVVEDILDSGRTLYKLKNHLLKKAHAASVTICVLLDKPGGRKARFQNMGRIDYIGFRIPAVFVAGGGLDYFDQFRELPFIVAVHDKALCV